MRQGQSKRLRGRNRGGGGGGNGGGGGGGGGKGPNPLTRSYESNGPDVKIRGTAGTIADKYVQLSRDAQSSGDPVAAENYMQHAEHYYRLLAAAQAQYQPHQTFVRADADDFADPADDDDDGEGEANGQTQPPAQPQPFQANGGQQPYVGARPNGGRPNGGQHQPGANGGGRDGEPRRFDRNERRDRNDRQDNRPDRGDRPARSDAQERPEEQAVVGGLPAFITGGASPQPPFVSDVPAPEPEIERAPITAAVEAEPAGESGDVEDGVRAPARGRRRRYGRLGRGGVAGEDGETGAGDAAPATDAPSD